MLLVSRRGCRGTPTTASHTQSYTVFRIFPISAQCGTVRVNHLQPRSRLTVGARYWSPHDVAARAAPAAAAMSFNSANRPSSAIPETVWPPRESDHDTGRLIKNMAFFTIFGWGVKATQMAILMETKLSRYTPEMKAITKRKWIGESTE